ncbi:MAG: YraN family protein [Chloroflexi bacterium]|nr:YraN family protein [Chloroflexota bacterium]
MGTSRQKLGRRGEEIARRYLEQKNYRVVESNFRTPWGEIDIVARKDDFLVFVEVRTRKGGVFGLPEESVTREKIQHIIDSAEEYMQSHDIADVSWRIDMVAINVDSNNRIERIDLLENVSTV